MEFGLLKSFVAIAETGTLTAAAAQLNLTQPSLSSQLKRLERQVGATLVERSAGARGVLLTPAGQVLLVEARSLLAHRDRAVVAVQRARDARPVRLTCGLPLGASPEFVARLIDAVADDIPGVVVDLQDPEQSLEQVRRLTDGVLDMALVRLPVDADGLRRVVLLEEDLGIWLPPGDPLNDVAPGKSGEPLPMSALDGRDVYTFARATHPGFHDALRDAFLDADVHPTWVELEARVSSLYMPELARRALPVAPQRVPFDTGELVFRPVAELPKVTTALLWRPDAPDVVQAAARAIAKTVSFRR